MGQMKLCIKESQEGYSIFLDETQLHDVLEYELKKDSASKIPNQAVLTLTMLVECTIGQDKSLRPV